MDMIVIQNAYNAFKKKKENFTFDYLEDVNNMENEIGDSIKNRLKNSKIIEEVKSELNQNGFSPQFSMIINNIVGLVISIISGYLAWTCSKRLSLGKRISFTILAFLFGMFYLVYAISFITSQCGR